MSEEREVVKISPLSGGSATATITEADRQRAHNEILKLTKSERKALLTRVLDRGFVVDRAIVENLPGDLHGEWVNKDPMEVERKRAMGFWVDTDYAPNRSMHGDGTQAGIMGDTIFMVTTKEHKELIDEMQRELYVRTHGSPEEVKRMNQKEESDVKQQAKLIDMPIIDEGKENRANEDELRSMLAREAATAQAAATKK